MKKKCELCNSPAQTYCDSDRSILCWDCDAKVHGANFLVSRHSRTLLCNHCKSPTPWKASGPTLGHTVSVCHRCAGAGENSGRGEEESERPDGDDPETNTEEEDDDDADDYDGEEEEEDRDEEDGENQVVPGSSTPPPSAASYSSSEDDLSETVNFISRKRMRENSPETHHKFSHLRSPPHVASEQPLGGGDR